MVTNGNLIERINTAIINNDLDSIQIGMKDNAIPNIQNVHMNNPHYLRLGFLYVDLSGYTNLTMEHSRKSVTRILNAFLVSMVEITRAFSGQPVGIAGDRLFSIFHKNDTGDNQESQKAVDCASKMNYIVEEVLNPFAENLLQKKVKLQVSIGIDYDFALMTRFRTGELNEYIFIGDAANFAAKLQNWTAKGSMRISGNIFNNLNNKNKWKKLRNRYGKSVYLYDF